MKKNIKESKSIKIIDDVKVFKKKPNRIIKQDLGIFNKSDKESEEEVALMQNKDYIKQVREES